MIDKVKNVDKIKSVKNIDKDDSQEFLIIKEVVDISNKSVEAFHSAHVFLKKANKFAGKIEFDSNHQSCLICFIYYMHNHL